MSQLAKRFFFFFQEEEFSRMQQRCHAWRSAAARRTLVKVSAADSDCDCTAGCWHQTSKGHQEKKKPNSGQMIVLLHTGIRSRAHGGMEQIPEFFRRLFPEA